MRVPRVVLLLVTVISFIILSTACQASQPTAPTTQATEAPVEEPPDEPEPVEEPEAPAEEPTEEDEATEAPTDESDGEETGAAGASQGILTVSQGSDPRTLSPLDSTFTFDQNVYGQINETLLVFSPDMKEIQPHLATSVENIDETTWQIKVREGVTFHNGEILDAEAVRYSLERLKASEAYAIWTGILGDIEVVDDNTVNLTTNIPSPLVPPLLARAGWVYPPQYAEEAGEDFATNPVGTGPYRFVEWQRDDRIVLEAYSDYWGGTPPLEQVIFRPIPEAAARVAALQAGEVDLIYQLPLDFTSQVEEAPDLSVISAPGMRLYALFLDYRDGTGPFADARVRQALNYGVDKQAILDALFQGQGIVLPGHLLHSGYFGANEELEPYPYDPERARELLAEAGYPEGIDTTLNCPTGRYVLDKELCEIMVGQLAEAGIRAELSLFESGEYATRMGATELGPMYYAGYLAPPDAFYHYSIYGPESAYRYHADNTEFDELVAEAAQELDRDRRQELYDQAAVIANEDPYAVYLWSLNEIYGINDRVQGWTPNWDESLTLRGVSVTGP